MNKTNEQTAFEITSILGAKYICSSWKVRVNLIISHFSIGSKGARDDESHLVGEW